MEIAGCTNALVNLYASEHVIRMTNVKRILQARILRLQIHA